MHRKKRKQHVLMLLIAVTWLALAGTVTPVRSQDLICCDTWIDADGNWVGAWRDCKAALQELSAASRAKACQQIKKIKPPPKGDAPWFRPFTDNASQVGCCPEAADACGDPSMNCTAASPPENRPCEPPRPENNPPWLNRDSPCRDRQRGTISWSQTRASTMDLSFTVSMCREVIRFIRRGAGSPGKSPPGGRSFDVCCDSWQNAANTGSPCDARRDIDCDGALNESDSEPERRSGRSDDFVSNSPLSNLPFWKKLYPEIPDQSGCKDCKWELVRVEYTCQDLGRRYETGWESSNVIDAAYNYQATWKCPANGQTQEKGGNVRMENLRCPREWSQTTRYWP